MGVFIKEETFIIGEFGQLGLPSKAMRQPWEDLIPNLVPNPSRFGKPLKILPTPTTDYTNQIKCFSMKSTTVVSILYDHI